MSKLSRAIKQRVRSNTKTEYEKRTNKTDWGYKWFELKSGFMDTCVYSWLDPINRFKEAVLRCYRWFPIIWTDRDWDYSNILNVLKHKIRFTRECIDKHGLHMDKDNTAKNMKIAEFLLQRLIDDDYYKYQNEQHIKKWGHITFGKNRRGNISADNKWSDCGMSRENIKSQKDYEQELKESRRMYTHSDYMRKQDEIYLFNHIRKYYTSWWN
jgi:hypothetical protein